MAASRSSLRLLTAVGLAFLLAGMVAGAEPPAFCVLLKPELPSLLGSPLEPPQAPVGPTSCFVRNPTTGASVTFLSHGAGTGKPMYLAGVRSSEANSDNYTLSDEPSLGPGAYRSLSTNGQTLELRAIKGDHMLTLMLAENAPLTPARIDAAREAFKRLLAKL